MKRKKYNTRSGNSKASSKPEPKKKMKPRAKVKNKKKIPHVDHHDVNLKKQGIVVPKKKKNNVQTSKTSFKFQNMDYMCSTMTLNSGLTSDEFKFLDGHIKSSFYYPEKKATDVYVYKSLLNTEEELTGIEFQNKVKASLGHNKSTFYQAKYVDPSTNEEKPVLLRIDKTFLLDRMFRSTSSRENFDDKRLSITHFRYLNNPQCANVKFLRVMKKITENVLQTAQNLFHNDFCVCICSIIVSLPGGEDQHIHIDDVRKKPNDDMLSCIVALHDDAYLNFESVRGNKVEKFTIPSMSGIFFGGLTKHGGCGYEKMNVRLHFYILKSQTDEVWDVFSGNLRENQDICPICKESKPVTNSLQQAAFRQHKYICRKRNQQKFIKMAKESKVIVKLDGKVYASDVIRDKSREEPKKKGAKSEEEPKTSMEEEFYQLVKSYSETFEGVYEVFLLKYPGRNLKWFMKPQYEESYKKMVGTIYTDKVKGNVNGLEEWARIFQKGLEKLKMEGYPEDLFSKTDKIHTVMIHIHSFMKFKMIYKVEKMVQETYEDCDDFTIDGIELLYESLNEQRIIKGELNISKTLKKTLDKVRNCYPERYSTIENGEKRLYKDVAEAINKALTKGYESYMPGICGTAFLKSDFINKNLCVFEEQETE